MASVSRLLFFLFLCFLFFFFYLFNLPRVAENRRLNRWINSEDVLTITLDNVKNISAVSINCIFTVAWGMLCHQVQLIRIFLKILEKRKTKRVYLFLLTIMLKYFGYIYGWRLKRQRQSNGTANNSKKKRLFEAKEEVSSTILRLVIITI